VAQTDATPLNVGFLTILQEPSGYLGGYLVLNHWGRPLEFRLSTAVQPNRVQQLLYGSTLQSYLHADLIGKTLVDKSSVPVQLIVTDREPVLDLRLRLDTPVAWLAAPGDPLAAALEKGGAAARPTSDEAGPVLCHPRRADDVVTIRTLLDRLDAALELSEPFGRIREAIAEARKMGATQRAAA
jgi:hypothetical protein